MESQRHVVTRTPTHRIACNADALRHTLDPTMSLAASLTIASTLAFHPYSAPSMFRAGVAPAAAEPTEGEQPGWDDVETPDNAAEQVVEGTEAPPPTTTPTEGTAPPTAAPVKPEYNKGTGLIIGASITGGLAWAMGLARMGFVKQCENAINGASEGETASPQTGVGAAYTCFAKAGVGNVTLGILQVPMNWATWGMAIGAGIVRGRYEGTEHAWSGEKQRKANAFIGAGAGMLAVGVIGRIMAAALAVTPYKVYAESCSTSADACDADKLFRGIRMRLFGVQLSSAMIAAGAGLLAFGVVYRKNYESESIRLKQVRFSPVLSTDPYTGASYTGFSVTGRF
jgi:hypothetical protein